VTKWITAHWELLAGIGIPILLSFLSWAVWQMFRRLWDIRNWEFTVDYSTPPRSAFNTGRRIIWQSKEPQKEGDFYKLDMKKERVISAIHFDHGDSCEVPKEWRMFLLNKYRGYVSPYKKKHPPHIDGKDTIIVCFERPVKTRYVYVKIRECRVKDDGIPYKWRIESIRLREKRLCGLWNPIIGEL
jgi:hypothetical protein